MIERLEQVLYGAFPEAKPLVQATICKVCGHEWWRHEGGGGRCFFLFGIEGDIPHECGCEGDRQSKA